MSVLCSIAIDFGREVMNDRDIMHSLLDKIIDGGHEGNINAVKLTMQVYAEAVDERKERKEHQERRKSEIQWIKAEIRRIKQRAKDLGYLFDGERG